MSKITLLQGRGEENLHGDHVLHAASGLGAARTKLRRRRPIWRGSEQTEAAVTKLRRGGDQIGCLGARASAWTKWTTAWRQGRAPGRRARATGGRAERLDEEPERLEAGPGAWMMGTMRARGGR